MFGFGIAILLCVSEVKAQGQKPLQTGNAGGSDFDAMREQVISGTKKSKTLSGWELLSNLYQIGLENLSADDKSIKFKSTIFGIDKIFHPEIKNSENYSRKTWERYVEPYINFSYQKNFNPSNITVGVNLSFINANDLTTNKELNAIDSNLLAKKEHLDNALMPAYDSINVRLQAGRITVLETKKLYSQLAKFVRSGSKDDLTDGLKTILTTGQIKEIVDFQTMLDSLALNISNRWNVTFSPQGTYAFNRSAIQGASFMFNGIKGYELFKNRSTQMIFKGGFVMGADSIVKVVQISRHWLMGQAGLNQVLLVKDITAVDGTINKIPCMELAVSGGYNWLTHDYTATEKRGQPSLNAKLGFLVGKDSWLLIPFTYNFATKDSYASISVKVNLGDAPFKKQSK